MSACVQDDHIVRACSECSRPGLQEIESSTTTASQGGSSSGPLPSGAEVLAAWLKHAAYVRVDGRKYLVLESVPFDDLDTGLAYEELVPFFATQPRSSASCSSRCPSGSSRSCARPSPSTRSGGTRPSTRRSRSSPTRAARSRCTWRRPTCCPTHASACSISRSSSSRATRCSSARRPRRRRRRATTRLRCRRASACARAPAAPPPRSASPPARGNVGGDRRRAGRARQRRAAAAIPGAVRRRRRRRRCRVHRLRPDPRIRRRGDARRARSRHPSSREHVTTARGLSHRRRLRETPGRLPVALKLFRAYLHASMCYAMCVCP